MTRWREATGCPMTVYGYTFPRRGIVAYRGKRGRVVSPQAKARFEVVRWFEDHGRNVTRTAQRFGLARDTVRAWVRRVAAEGPAGLEDRSRRPKRVRQPATAGWVIAQVLTCRREQPTWSKYKLHAVLARQGVALSASTIGRILKRYGRIPPKATRKRQQAARRPKKRFPRGLVIRAPGDLVQLDTKILPYVGDRRLVQFTAIDVLTKLRVLAVHTTCSSWLAAQFWEHCQATFPFRIRAVQTDNGSEWKGAFAALMQEFGVAHYWTDVRSPKQNSYVERSHRTDEEEFYQQGNVYPSLTDQRIVLERWQDCYNRERPHQSLNQLTPWHYFERYQAGRGTPFTETIVLQA